MTIPLLVARHFARSGSLHLLNPLARIAFLNAQFFSQMTFESGSRLSCVEEFAFANSSSFSSIEISSSLEGSSGECSSGRTGVLRVALESCYRRSLALSYDPFAFHFLLSCLTRSASFTVYASHKSHLPQAASSSGLARSAFSQCSSLAPICIPPSVVQIDLRSFFHVI
jgi:hypothetical protein